MPFSDSIKLQVLVESARHCCVCHRYRGVKVEVHHIIPESISNDNTYENAICLCFDCHCDAGHYNPNHSKGTKFSPKELRLQKTNWKKVVEKNKIELVGDEENRLHFQYLVCMNREFIQEVCEKKFSSLPFEKVMLYNGLCYPYHQYLLRHIPEYLSREFRVYKDELEYLEKNDQNKRNTNDANYSYSRFLNEKIDLDLLTDTEKSIIKLYRDGGLNDKDFLEFHAFHLGPGCGDEDFQESEELLEYIQIKTFFVIYASITNKHSSPIIINDLYCHEASFPSQTFIETIPPFELTPNSTLLFPIGQFIEHIVDDYSYAVSGESSDRQKYLYQYHLPARESVMFFGKSVFIDRIAYRFGNSFINFYPHTYNESKIFYLDSSWGMGSCPHCFVKVNDDYYYYREILTNGENQIDQSSLILSENIQEFIIAEIEDEITFIAAIKVNDQIVAQDIKLCIRESYTLYNLCKGDSVEILGEYKVVNKMNYSNPIKWYRKKFLIETYLQRLIKHNVPHHSNKGQ